MRRILLGTALICLFATMLALPALASAGVGRMPPNDVAILKALIARGRIPMTATSRQKADFLQSYLQRRLGSKPEDLSATGRNLGDLTLRGRTPWGRAIALKPGVMVDNALVILVEFNPSDYTDPNFPGEVFPGGPLHGQIPAPAAGDNSSFWPGPGDKGFGTQHYQQMLFGKQFPIYDKNGKLRGTSTDTMQKFYLEMSKGTYKVTGQIKNWVQVPYPESWYGRDSANGTDDYTGQVWRVVKDAVDALKAANPGFDWSRYDQKNPFGIAGDDPNVPDGYVDHLILVHAGVDESAGGGAQGNDSIWAHSSWVDMSNGLGPASAGGYQVDSTTSAARPDGIWVGPYTINPEDGAIGVFCHEFGHDLGLPDEYDTTYTGESPSAFWTLMAQGSWSGKKWGLGTKPTPMNVWDKVSLGYVTPRTVSLGAVAKFRVKPAATGAADRVAVKVALPPKWHETVLSGASDPNNPEFWSGMGNDLDNAWTVWNSTSHTALDITVPQGGGALTFQSWYEIEGGYDYGFVQVSTDGGGTWTSIPGNHTVDAGSGNQGLSGASGGGVAGQDDPVWESESYSLNAYAGQSIEVRFRYVTDPGVSYRGWEVTGVSIPTSDGAVDFGGADTGYLDPDTAWQSVDGQVGQYSTRYYLAEYRNRSGFDTTLASVYNWNTGSNVQFYPYNTGLHLIYRDTFYQDNDVGTHPGAGGWMVVDAHPVPDIQAGVMPWATRVQVRDAAFSTAATPTLWLTPWANTPETLQLPGRSGQATFDDSKMWWFPWAPDSGVQVDDLGVRMTVSHMSPSGLTLRIHGADRFDR
jgi:immune inhibitor A